MAKLNQIVALVAAKKGRAAAALEEQQNKLLKGGLLEGISRVYQPRDDAGERLPPESKHVQVKALDVFGAAASEVGEVFDFVFTQDVGNTLAKADVIVGDVTIIKDAPVTYLLYLSKKLKEIEKFIDYLPTLDPGEQWKHDANADAYASAVKTTTHTKKTPKNHVVSPATAQHPAQVQVYSEDVIVGYWNTVKFSGAIPAQQKNAMLARVRQLQDAVRVARETANGAQVSPLFVGSRIFGFIRGSDAA